MNIYLLITRLAVFCGHFLAILKRKQMTHFSAETSQVREYKVFRRSFSSLVEVRLKFQRIIQQRIR